jgi:hypothetical protein
MTGKPRTPEECKELLGGDYTLTGDNLLKMLAVMLRVNCGIPVVLMGECGCGKTRLLEYLAAFLAAEMLQLGIHGGTTEKNIIDKFDQAQQYLDTHQEADRVFVFLDEINTCEHMGLLNEIIALHSIHGKRLPLKLQVFAACNPYRERKFDDSTVGLDYQDSTPGTKGDEMKKLVYRVRPIPDGTLVSVFDYGALASQVELRYIKSMIKKVIEKSTKAGAWPGAHIDPQTVENRIDIFAELVWEASNFVREHEGDLTYHSWEEDGKSEEEPERSATSLRDVKRVLKLLPWFARTATGSQLPSPVFPPEEWYKERKPEEEEDEGWSASQGPAGFDSKDFHFATDPLTPRAMILSLALVYYFRLSDRLDRQEFHRRLECKARKLCPTSDHGLTIEQQKRHIKHEEEVYANSMDLKRGDDKNISMNEALRENVFLMTVCILNRIPVFVVGKPGSSKSLAIKIVTENLNGLHSANEFWQKTNAVALVPFQCSNASTAEAITTQFDKAKRKHESLTKRIVTVKISEQEPTMGGVGTKLEAQLDMDLDIDGNINGHEMYKLKNVTNKGIIVEGGGKGKVLGNFLTIIRSKWQCNTVTALLLDEVGLAEHSPHMPLKALHTILNDLEVPTIGISNWVLDPAKMNRAVCLQRPDPDATDLQQMAKGMSEVEGVQLVGDGEIKKLATLHDYISDNVTGAPLDILVSTPLTRHLATRVPEHKKEWLHKLHLTRGDKLKVLKTRISEADEETAKVLRALQKYKQLHNIPKLQEQHFRNFEVPLTPTWPEEMWGMLLGKAVSKRKDLLDVVNSFDSSRQQQTEETAWRMTVPTVPLGAQELQWKSKPEQGKPSESHPKPNELPLDQFSLLGRYEFWDRMQIELSDVRAVTSNLFEIKKKGKYFGADWFSVECEYIPWGRTFRYK